MLLALATPVLAASGSVAGLSAQPVKGGKYVGKTSQRLRISLKVSRDGKTLRLSPTIGCHPPGMLKLELNITSKVRIRRDGSFGGPSDHGKFVSARQAKGTFHLRFRTQAGICDTGVVRWQARLRA
jgi:hypothetical protein